VASDVDVKHAPATGRARQIDAAIKLENITGQPAQFIVSDTSDTSLPLGSVVAPSASSSDTAQKISQSHHPMQGARNAPDDPNVQPQIVRGLTTMLNQRGGVMTMRLDPPDLGDVRVQMTLHQGTVSAEFHASTTQAQALLDKNMAVLRHALEGQGLTVDRLTVQVSTQHQQSMRDDNANNANQGQSQQRFGHDAAGGESRGRHDQPQQQEESKWRSADFTSLFETSELSAFSARTNETAASR
jgi:flagellar hook-length control protein FliK